MTDKPDPFATPSPDLSDWTAQSQAHRQRADALRTGNKTALFNALAAAGVTHVLVSFDGYGDSGQIESIIAKAGDAGVSLPAGDLEVAAAVWDQPEPRRETVTISAAIEALAYDCLETSHDGWEINDGAYGDFMFDVAAQNITLDYNERRTETEYSQHVF